MTRVFGVIGYPVAHSLSPVMHNAGFREEGLDAVYVPLAVPPERLAAAMEGVRALGLGGVNVTLPHKEAVLAHLDGVSEEARVVGAVNTVACRDGRLEGFNTDGPGFVRSLREAGVEPRGARALLFGAGGAARAIAFALCAAGVDRLWVVNRTPARAEALAVDLARAGGRVEAAPLIEAAVRQVAADVTLVVNATSAGLEGRGGSVWSDFRCFPPAAVAVDIVYRPEWTPFLEAARAAGLRTVGGLGMLVHQAALAWEVWFGRPGPVRVFYRSARQILAQPAGGMGSRRGYRC
ncbi:MAG: shikimate dehydrogenase [Clostridia bacterium]|nr:shikimate dehydrogenase [Clostridia bacterium]